MDIQHPDSLPFGATELAILCVDLSTDILNGLIILQITTLHTSTRCGNSQWRLNNEQPWKELTFACIHHGLGITSFLPEISEQAIITSVEYSTFQITPITVCMRL